MGDRDDDAAARQEARQKGRPTYINKRPCRAGHKNPIRSTKTGLCRECTRLYYQSNKEKINARTSERAKKNRAKIRESRRRKNTDEVREKTKLYFREWRKKNRHRTAIYRQNWRKRNRELTNVYTRNRRAALHQADGFFTIEDISKIYKMQHGKCAYCKAALRGQYEIDHIIALTKGGTNWPRNIQLLCSRTVGNACNQSKNAKDAIDFARSLGRLL